MGVIERFRLALVHAGENRRNIVDFSKVVDYDGYRGGAIGCAMRSEIVRIFNEARAKRVKRVKIIEWVSLVVDEAVCRHFAGFIAPVFIKALSQYFHSLTCKHYPFYNRHTIWCLGCKMGRRTFQKRGNLPPSYRDSLSCRRYKLWRINCPKRTEFWRLRCTG